MQPELQVVQRVNPIPGLQSLWQRALDARRPALAAFWIAQLYVSLRALGKLDGVFKSEWRCVLEGRFLECVGAPVLRARIAWMDIWQARSALEALMDRRGMWFQLRGPDPVDQEQGELEADLRSGQESPGLDLSFFDAIGGDGDE